MSDFATLKAETSKHNLNLILNVFDELVGVLKLFETEHSFNIPANVLQLFEQRKTARAAKNFELADCLRNEIEQLGFVVEETRKGSRLVPKNKV